MKLTVLGNTVRHAIDHVEVFPAPKNISSVTFTNDELCSVTGHTEHRSSFVKVTDEMFFGAGNTST